MAPRVAKGDTYSNKCDIWSLGVTLYILLCAKWPFNGEDCDELKEAILSGEY